MTAPTAAQSTIASSSEQSVPFAPLCATVTAPMPAKLSWQSDIRPAYPVSGMIDRATSAMPHIRVAENRSTGEIDRQRQQGGREDAADEGSGCPATSAPTPPPGAQAARPCSRPRRSTSTARKSTITGTAPCRPAR